MTASGITPRSIVAKENAVSGRGVSGTQLPMSREIGLTLREDGIIRAENFSTHKKPAKEIAGRKSMASTGQSQSNLNLVFGGPIGRNRH